MGLHYFKANWFYTRGTLGGHCDFGRAPSSRYRALKFSNILGQAGRRAATDGRQFVVACLIDIGAPKPLSNRCVRRQRVVGPYRIDERIDSSQAMKAETAPWVIARLFDHIGTHRVCFNVPQHG